MNKKEIKKLLDNLEYCNNYIKFCETKDCKKIISNTKFYELKNCVMTYILRNAQELGIELGCCVLQPQGDHTLVLIPVIYNDNVYEFHQIYKDIEHILLELNIKCECSETEYERPIKQIDEDIDKFNKCITQIKHYVWNHYKKTLADPYVYIDQPMKFMRMVELVNKKLKFEIFTNGGLMKYHITARMKYKGQTVAQKPLAKIRKNIFQYIALKNENNSGKLADITNQLFKEFNHKNTLICRIENLSHYRLEQSSLEKSDLEKLIEDCNYEEAINKLESIIESLEGGYCKILNIIEGNEEDISK